MSKFYKRHASCNASLHLAKWFQMKRLFFYISQSETIIAHGGHICSPDQDEISKFCNLGLPTDTSCQVWFHLAKQFQWRLIFYITQSETRIAHGGHICSLIGTKWRNFVKDLPQMLHVKYGSIWPSSFRLEEFFISANQKQELPMAAVYIVRSRRNEETL